MLKLGLEVVEELVDRAHLLWSYVVLVELDSGAVSKEQVSQCAHELVLLLHECKTHLFANSVQVSLRVNNLLVQDSQVLPDQVQLVQELYLKWALANGLPLHYSLVDVVEEISILRDPFEVVGRINEVMILLYDFHFEAEV